MGACHDGDCENQQGVNSDQSDVDGIVTASRTVNRQTVKVYHTKTRYGEYRSVSRSSLSYNPHVHVKSVHILLPYIDYFSKYIKYYIDCKSKCVIHISFVFSLVSMHRLSYCSFQSNKLLWAAILILQQSF